MSSMAERIKTDDPGVRRMKITRASAGSFGKSADEEEVRRISADEEQEMILGGLDLIADASGSTGFGAFVKKAIEGNNPQNHGFVDDQGMPHSRPASGTTGFAAFQQRQAADGREDHNYTEQQKVTQPTTGFGAGEGIDTNMEEDRRKPGNDGGLMSTSELMQRIQELIPKEERFRIPPEKKDLPPEKEPVKTADDSTPDGTQWQSEVVDETSPRDRNLPDIPEALPEKYVPEQGDGSHPLPNESFEDWGTPPVPGVSQNYPQDPAKLTNIMGSFTRIRLSDGRVLVGKVVAENNMRLRFFGRVAGDRADSSFELWKRDIIGPREAVRVKAPVRQAREITNLESAYDLYNQTREAKDPKKDYVVEKAIVSPSDGVDRSVEKATNTRTVGARTMGNKGGLKKSAGAKAYDVFLNGEEIDTVFYTGYDSADEVKRSLVDHDGYDPSIEVLDRETGERTAGEMGPQDDELYQRLESAGIQIKNEGGDVLVENTPEAVSIINQYQQEVNDFRNIASQGQWLRIGSRITAEENEERKCIGCGEPEDLVGHLDADNLCQRCRAEQRNGSRRAADESKDKTVTPATGPKGNVATNDTMKDDTFYGDDKVLHDQLDKHEKRASVLKREAMLKLKMADNYEKAANMKMAKEMDKQATILYTEWKKTMATIAGMKKEMASQRRITAAAIAPKLFFQNRETEDKNNPFS